MSIIAMQSVRCIDCKSMLFAQGVFRGVVEIKCRKCATINRVEFDNGQYRTSRKSEDDIAGKRYTMVE